MGLRVARAGIRYYLSRCELTSELISDGKIKADENDPHVTLKATVISLTMGVGPLLFPRVNRPNLSGLLTFSLASYCLLPQTIRVTLGQTIRYDTHACRLSGHVGGIMGIINSRRACMVGMRADS